MSRHKKYPSFPEETDSDSEDIYEEDIEDIDLDLVIPEVPYISTVKKQKNKSVKNAIFTNAITGVNNRKNIPEAQIVTNIVPESSKEIKKQTPKTPDQVVPQAGDDSIMPPLVPISSEKLMVRMIRDPTTVVEDSVTPGPLEPHLLKDTKCESTAVRTIREKLEAARKDAERLEKELEDTIVREKEERRRVNEKWLAQEKRKNEDKVIKEITDMLDTPEARLGMSVMYLLSKNFQDFDGMMRATIQKHSNSYITSAIVNIIVEEAERKKTAELMSFVVDSVLNDCNVEQKGDRPVAKLYDNVITDSFNLIPKNKTV